jgi:hypothetical protein
MALVVKPPRRQRQEERQGRTEVHAYGEVRDGDCTVFRNRDFLHAVAEMKGKVHVVVETANRRTDQHNRYYWGMLNWLSQETGYDPTEIHEINKRECNTHIRYVLNKKTGEIEEKVYGGSTKRMRVGEFAEFIERVRRYWAEHGYSIPDEYWKQ